MFLSLSATYLSSLMSDPSFCCTFPRNFGQACCTYRKFELIKFSYTLTPAFSLSIAWDIVSDREGKEIPCS